MVGNSWPWLRLIAVFAASLIWVSSGALAQTTSEQTENSEIQSSISKTAVRDLRLGTLASDYKIAAQWRFVSDGKTVKTAPERTEPELMISGLRTGEMQRGTFAEQDVQSVIIIVLAGKTNANIKYFYETATAAISALPGGRYRVLIGQNNDVFEWIEDVQLDTRSTDQSWDKIFKPAAPNLDPKPLTARALVQAFSSSMSVLKQADPQARAALIAPEGLFPDDTNLLNRLAGAAYAQRISFFPMAPPGGVQPARAQQMIDVAGPTAGRFLPDALTGRSISERLALFSEFLGGGNAVFEINKYHRYRLPTENIKPVELTVNYGDLTDTLTLAHTRPVLKGGALAAAFLDPRHWGRWLIDPARWLYGMAGLLIWLCLIGGIYRLIFPKVKLFVQIAGDDEIQKVRRLPVIIGRGGSAGVNLEDENVSREHVEIRKENGVLTLVDLGSSNGTWIGGERVKSTELKSVQTVQIGSQKLILRLNSRRAPVKTVVANS
jgi:hypothetical protein